MDYGAWYPCSRGLTTPVIYIQCLNSQPTGLYFVVPRWRHMWIWALVKVHKVPLIGKAAMRTLARMQVTYRCAVLTDEQRQIRA